MAEPARFLVLREAGVPATRALLVLFLELFVELLSLVIIAGVLLAVLPSSGALKGVAAMVGGYDWRTSVFNRATQARRQAGSAIKPFVYGLAFFAGLLKWLHVIGWDAVLGLSLLQTLFLVALSMGLARTSRLPAWPLWAACLWVAQEWARDRIPLGGFPWGRLAFANTGSPFTPLAALARTSSPASREVPPALAEKPSRPTTRLIRRLAMHRTGRRSLTGKPWLTRHYGLSRNPQRAPDASYGHSLRCRDRPRTTRYEDVRITGQPLGRVPHAVSTVWRRPPAAGGRNHFISAAGDSREILRLMFQHRPKNPVLGDY